jgi:hypothetical protein
MKEVKTHRACGSLAHLGGKDKYKQGCGRENLGERDHLKDLDITREYYNVDLKDMVGVCMLYASGAQWDK